METWCLYEEHSGAYFVRMTAIGPMGGSRDEARLYSTAQAAMNDPAYLFPLTVYRPRRLDTEEGE